MRNRGPRSVACLLLLVFSLAAGGDSARVERIGAFTGTALSASVKEALAPEGYRVVDEKGMVLCELWLPKSVPTQESTGALGVIYPEFAESTFMGVISLPQGGKDFRGQSIRPGVYTLRYALMPDDGNHMGVSEYRDFLLLIPATADRDPQATLGFAQLVERSKKASGTNHPAPLSLVAPEREKSLPVVYVNDAGHLVLVVSLPVQSGGRRPVAIVVRGQAEQ